MEILTVKFEVKIYIFVTIYCHCTLYFVLVIFTILYTSSRSKLRLRYVSSKEFGSDEHTIISSRTRQPAARRAVPAFVDAKAANPAAPSDCRMATIPRFL